MAFWSFKKKIKISKNEQVQKRAKFLNIIVRGCVSHPAYERWWANTRDLQNLQRCARCLFGIKKFR